MRRCRLNSLDHMLKDQIDGPPGVQEAVTLVHRGHLMGNLMSRPSSSWKTDLLALFNTLNKDLESISLSRQKNQVPDAQMRARRGESAELALELLTEQVHAAGGQCRDEWPL